MRTLIVLAVTFFSLNVFANSTPNTDQTFDVKVTKKGFEPSSIKAKTKQDVTLKITRETDATCAKKVIIPEKKISQDLPLNKEVEIKLGKLEKGEIRFGCGMGMMVGGVISVN